MWLYTALNAMSTEILFFMMFYSVWNPGGLKLRCFVKSVFLSLAVSLGFLFLFYTVIPAALSAIPAPHLIQHTINVSLNLLVLFIVEKRRGTELVCHFILLYMFFYALYGSMALIFEILPFSDSLTEQGKTALLYIELLPLWILFSFISKKWQLKTIVSYLSERVHTLFHCCALVFAILLFACATELLYRVRLNKGSSVIFSAAFLLAVFFSFGKYLQSQKLQRDKEAQQEFIIKQQDMYIHSLEAVQTEMRMFKHDYKNQMASLYLSSKDGNLRAIEQSIHRMIDDFDENIGKKMQLTTQLSRIQLTEVKSILMKKLTEIEQKKIPFHFEVMYPVEEVSMNLMDLSCILGILLDNAIEEAEKISGDVSLILSSQEKGLHVLVENTVKEPVNIKKLFHKGYSTKGTGRGLGLYSFQKLLNKYPNVSCVTSCENGRFLQNIFIEKI